MRTRGPHKRVLLFLIAVVLPSSVLIVLTWRMIGQQQELREKRLADERRRLAREIGHELLARLEEVKMHQTGAATSGGEPLDTLAYASSEVVLTALTDGERVLLPWEVGRSRNGLGESPGETAFTRKIRRAEEEEFVARRWTQANTLYLECIDQAESPAQQAYARLARARVLAKLDRADERAAECREVLAASPGITDEHGVPLCLYAAKHLLEQGDSFNDVARLIAGELDAQRWLSPAESYMLRDLVAILVRSSPEPGIPRQMVEDYQQRILEYIRRLEQAHALREAFPPALKARLKDPNQATEPVWAPFGAEPWLVGLAPSLPGKPRLVIVAEGKSTLGSVIPRIPYSEEPLGDVRLTTSEDLAGEPLGANFPGLRLAFPTDGQDALSSYWSLQRFFYLIAISLVLCVTLFGAYFLWSDVGRESRMAEMRSQFIASVSHELKTPLTAIRMFAETLRLGRTEDPQARAEYLDTIVNESHRLTRLLNNVLDFSKIEKGKRTYRKEPASLSQTVQAAVRAMEYTLAQQDFQLSVNVEDDLPDIEMDRDAIEQAILNLLSNAMKYSGESRTTALRVYRSGDHAAIEVSDHGIGIPAGEQKRIFKEFHRVSSKENERVPGAGLGLALVSHIVTAHGGRVDVRSVVGEGSTFTISLPLENTG